MAPKTRQQLLNDIASLFPDNNTQEISEADLRAFLTDAADSCFNELSDFNDLRQFMTTEEKAKLAGIEAHANAFNTPSQRLVLSGDTTIVVTDARKTIRLPGTGDQTINLVDYNVQEIEDGVWIRVLIPAGTGGVKKLKAAAGVVLESSEGGSGAGYEVTLSAGLTEISKTGANSYFVNGAVSAATGPVAVPTVSNVVGTASTTTVVTGVSATTTGASGTLHFGLFPSSTVPNNVAIVAGTGAIASGDQVVSAAGAQAIADFTGLTAGATYRIWATHEISAGVFSNPVSSVVITMPQPVQVLFTPDAQVEIVPGAGISDLEIDVTSPPEYAITDAALDLTDISTAPFALVQPYITGGTVAGETITIYPGLWAYDPDNGEPSLSIELRRNGVPIATIPWDGVTYPTRTLVLADEGTTLTPVVTPTDLSGPEAAVVGTPYVVGAGGDTTAPILSAPVDNAVTSTTASIGATTDENNGEMYAVASSSVTPPSTAQIIAGQDHTGASVPSNSITIDSAGAKLIPISGLTPETTRYGHIVHVDLAGNVSNVVSGNGFATPAAPGVPTLQDMIDLTNGYTGMSAFYDMTNPLEMYREVGKTTNPEITATPEDATVFWIEQTAGTVVQDARASTNFRAFWSGDSLTLDLITYPNDSVFQWRDGNLASRPASMRVSCVMGFNNPIDTPTNIVDNNSLAAFIRAESTSGSAYTNMTGVQVWINEVLFEGTTRLELYTALSNAANQHPRRLVLMEYVFPSGQAEFATFIDFCGTRIPELGSIFMFPASEVSQTDIDAVRAYLNNLYGF